MKKLFTLLCLLSFTTISSSQARFLEGGLIFGAATIAGDLVDSDNGVYDDFSFVYGISGRYYLHSNLAIRGSIISASLTSDDNNSTRGFESSTKMTELALDIELDLLGRGRGKKGLLKGRISPYIFGGVGIAFIDPKATFGISNKRAIPEQSVEIPKSRLVVPLGAGLRFNLSPTWAIGLEVAPRLTFFDYLDGVSLSGNPEKNDWYAFTNIQFFHKIHIVDTDGDGVADKDDACPEIAGPKESTGCPDRDKDGVPDSRDQCIDLPGVKATGGCPDSDKDGIIDTEDSCPTQAGTKAAQGCPDSDGDGVEDGVDVCPEEKGLVNNQGCPIVDKDGDGILNEVDECPDEAGPVSNGGCPLEDADGDGVLDKEDECPTTKGVAENRGCPYQDFDGDGVLDKDDKCPREEGVASNDGCPELDDIKEARVILENASNYLLYADNDADFVSQSSNLLNDVVQVMKDHPTYNLKIEGFFGDQGTNEKNQIIADRWAQRCFEYLKSKGVSEARMNYTGFGNAYHVATNKTTNGQYQNRRIEFKLH